MSFRGNNNGNSAASINAAAAGEDQESITGPLISSQVRFTPELDFVGGPGRSQCPTESLDYEILVYRSRSKAHVVQYIYMKWFSCFLVGLIVGLIGFCNNLAGVKFVVTSNMML